MPLRFFNTLTRRKEPFLPLKEGEVRLYTCGPTVYDYAHIGNLRTYTFEDLLRRYLKFKGYRVTQVMNLTDVDDKTIKGCTAMGITLDDYTKPFIDAFFEDLASLNIERAEVYPRATQHIPEMAAMIMTLLGKGLAYKSEDGSLYFAVSRFPSYGQLAHIQVGELKEGARVSHDEYEKEEACDFALWKAWDAHDGEVFWPKGEAPEWPEEIPRGRPGWHIECSAMSMKYLGESFDIHTGGVDNIFPHHQNEIAQSEAATGKKFVSYWLHTEHLIVENKKMSKSLGNFYTLKDLAKKGNDPLALRYLYVSSHYRNKLNFTFPSLEAARSALETLREFVRRLSSLTGGDNQNPGPGKSGPVDLVHTVSEMLRGPLQRAREEFEEAMDDDLNTPRALAALFDFLRVANPRIDEGEVSQEEAREILSVFLHCDTVLGLRLERSLSEVAMVTTTRNINGKARIQKMVDQTITGKASIISEEQASLIRERDEARKMRDFQKADIIRTQLQEMGIIIEDTPRGTRVKQVRG